MNEIEIKCLFDPIKGKASFKDRCQLPSEWDGIPVVQAL